MLAQNNAHTLLAAIAPAAGRSQCGFVNVSISAGRNWPVLCAIACFAGAQCAGEDLEELWSAGDAFGCLSVRSGFDSWLKALQLPPGSEVLVSAITIRDMVRIIEAHNLVPVPVDLNPEDLSVDIASLNRAISPKTRAILVAHLFGTRQPMEPILDVARKHGLFVAENCAQAFAGRHFTGDPSADVTMFSFGSIKTATAWEAGCCACATPTFCRACESFNPLTPFNRAALREKDRQARADEAHVVRPAISATWWWECD